MTRGRQHAEFHGNSRRPAGRDADRADLPAGGPRADFDRRDPADLPLARTHVDGRVTFQGLDIVESFRDCLVDVLLGHVLTETDEALAVALPRLRAESGTCRGRFGTRNRFPLMAELFEMRNRITQRGSRFHSP